MSGVEQKPSSVPMIAHDTLTSLASACGSLLCDHIV